ncbi:MAG: hypothetical protein IKW51_08845 [Bacteroidales bacterium]|nr:hypothetical protein [Bacteroidales bacterium]
MNIDLSTLSFISAFIDRKFGLSKNKSLSVLFGYDASQLNGSPTCNVSFNEIINAVKSESPIQFQCVEYNKDVNHCRYLLPHSVQINTDNWSEIIVQVFEGGTPTFTYTNDTLSVSMIEVNKL